MALLDSIRNRPNFFIVGAGKAGTTRLHYLLGKHPEIFVSSVKEPEFFAHDPPRPGKLEQYLELFEEVGGARVIGEASVGYSREARNPGAARRLFEFNPRARIIYVVRHPLRRIESGWVHRRYRQIATPRDFCRAVRSGAVESVEVSLYWKQISEYRKHFPDEQILLLFFEEFIQDEPATLRRCFEFLGVDPDVAVDCSNREKLNASVGRQAASAFFDFLRSVPGYQKSLRLFPQSVRDKFHASQMRPIPKPVWDRATWQWAVDQLQPDAEQLLAHAGKPADFWKWEFESNP